MAANKETPIATYYIHQQKLIKVTINRNDKPKSSIDKPAKNTLERMSSPVIGFHHNINHKVI